MSLFHSSKQELWAAAMCGDAAALIGALDAGVGTVGVDSMDEVRHQ